MAQTARLITPDGKTITLPDEIYQRVKEMLAVRRRPRPPALVRTFIRETYGKYTGGKSLTEALLAERSADRAREKSKLSRQNG